MHLDDILNSLIYIVGLFLITMKIIAHRGFWKTESEKNTKVAIERAIENGFGFETDFRDCGGKILISHNPPKGEEMTAEEVFKMYQAAGSQEPLALNIKADGLQDMMSDLLEKYKITNYFFFDMSVCDTVIYADKKLKIASRLSEFEAEMPFYNDSTTIWIDYFNSDGPTIQRAIETLKDGKIACIVSPELHKRDYQQMWKQLKAIKSEDRLFLCTDYPDKAKEYFK